MLQIRLKSLREEIGISQYELATLMGVSQSTIGMWESGKNKPEFQNLQKLCDVFGVGMDYLVGRTEYKRETDEADAFADAHSPQFIELLALHGGDERAALAAYHAFKTAEAEDVQAEAPNTLDNRLREVLFAASGLGSELSEDAKRDILDFIEFKRAQSDRT